MSVSSIRYLRAWEVNRDGTRAGLAVTAVDIDVHAPTRMKLLPAVLEPGRSLDELVLYGELVHRNLFRQRYAYALEIWGNMRSTGQAAGYDAGTVAPNIWGYCVFPLVRTNHADPDVDDDTLDYTYAKYTDADGVAVDAVRFNIHTGHAWGEGPHPVRFVEHDNTLHPAHIDPLRADIPFMFATTTMAPSAALQYTEHITKRQVADTWPA
jgi:hypothetical protein